MPRILFPFTRAKLNSIARLAEGGGKKSYDIYSGNETKTQVCCFWTLADGFYALARSCDPNLHTYMIAKVIKVTFNILNFHSTLSLQRSKRHTTSHQKCSLGSKVYSMHLKFWTLKRLNKGSNKMITQWEYLCALFLKNVIKSPYSLYYIHFCPKMM